MQKLLQAGLAAKEQGYTLKIYDSFRPQTATIALFHLTDAILGTYVPPYTYSGKKVNDLGQLDWEREATEPPTEEPAPSGTEPAEETSAAPTEGANETEAAFSFLSGHGNVQPAAGGKMQSKTSRPSQITYKSLMTNYGEYSLSKFLAPGLSRHNFGVALDLTLVNAEGKELSMQTSMHDLSWYSAFKRNNTNANILYKIMSGAGMTCISSEWWHYQDNEIYSKHAYRPLMDGVSWECWVADQIGWRYRLADGSFYVNCTQTIGEQSYTFDEAGYVMN
jgi:D-alanyl-D-alanine dipeptidase